MLMMLLFHSEYDMVEFLIPAHYGDVMQQYINANCLQINYPFRDTAITYFEI